MILNFHFLPAKYGDCILVEYGNQDKPGLILIDGGTGGTKKHIKEKLRQYGTRPHLDLLVITHIDRDHIEGILSLLEEDDLEFTVGDVWFNGWNHLPGNENLEPFGAVQGERLTAAIIKHELKWNDKLKCQPVKIEDGKVKTLTLGDDLKIKILSPANQQLDVLKDKWEEEVKAAGLEPGFGLIPETEPGDDEVESFGDIPDVELLCEEEFHEDEAAANGSSIAFIIEYKGKRVLLAGDAFPSLILESLNTIFPGKPAKMDLVKLSHHASAHNTSPDLIKKLKCKRFVISTNGSIYKHPSQVTIARIINSNGKGTELIFNYRSKYNEVWNNEILKEKHGYKVMYPDTEGISLKIL